MEDVTLYPRVRQDDAGPIEGKESASATPYGGQDVTNEGEWNSLEYRTTGSLFRAPSPKFYSLCESLNHRYSGRFPGGVLCAETETDIVEALAWCKKNKMRIVPRGGGHSYAGFSTAQDGLLVDTSKMRGVQVDVHAQTVTVGPGVRNSEVFQALQGTNLLLPGGRCPAVGVAGLVLGGGIGLATRQLGLTCDSLISTRVATSVGETLVCSSDQNYDLFWACRGGAGGNFGFNTSFTFRLHPVDTVTVYDLSWDWKEASTVLGSIAKLIDDETYKKVISCQFGLRTRGARVYAQGIFFGSAADARKALTVVTAAAKPNFEFVEERKIWPAMSYFYVEAGSDPYLSKSIVSNSALSEDTIQALVDDMNSWKERSVDSFASVSFFAMGGQDAEVSPTATAFVHRNAHFIVSMTAYWADSDSDSVSNANCEWLRSLYSKLSYRLGGAAFQNFPDPELVDWWTAYYGENYSRLVAIKNKYDPSRLFEYAQSIGNYPRV